MQSLSAAVAGRGLGGRSGATALRATPLTPETRRACAQNLLAERLTQGPQFVPPASLPAAADGTGSAAVPLVLRMASESDSGRTASAAPRPGPAAPLQPPAALPQAQADVEMHLAVVAQVAALADGGVYGLWSSCIAEPQCCGARAVFRKAQDLLELGVLPDHLAPLLKRRTATLKH